jgi:Carboxypeptidase regulatory-like domain
MRMRAVALCAILSILVFAIAPAGAQEVTAGVYGSVTDASGAVIPGAAISVRNVDTSRVYDTLADESGKFILTLLPIGNYEVTAEAAGFKKSVVTGVVLRVNDNRRITFTMELGQIAELVRVEAAAVTVNTASGTTSAVLGSDDMLKMPSPGRYVMPFALLMPGAISTTPFDRRNNNTSVNGVRPTHNAWLLDGGYNIDTGGNWSAPLAPNIEMVAEFRAIRGNYSAEFGTGGGSQFNVITRSGTNQFHGSLFEFVRNDSFNARNYFNPTRAAFKGNEFGGTIGGPVILPKLYNGTDKTFFFFMLATIKERREDRFFQKLPEPAYRNGDFSALGRVINDPNTGQPFPGNVIPASRIDRNAAAYNKMFPEINFRDSLGRNWTSVTPRRDDTPQLNVRLDHNFSQNHRITGRYYREVRESNYNVNPGFDWLNRTDRTPANNIVINFSSTFRHNLINDFNFTRSHNRIMQFPPEISASKWGVNVQQLFPDTEQTYPLDSLNLTKVPDRIPTFTVTNYTNLDVSAPWSNYQSIFEYKDNLTWIKGAHTVKTGFNYAYEIKFEPTNTDVFGRFGFDGRYTGDAYADFLIGRSFQYDETDTVAFNDNRRNAFETYVDDSWKVSRRLTLNFGLRYSFFPPAHEPDDRFRVFRKESYDPAKAVTVNSSGQIPKGSGERFNGLVNPVPYWNSHKKNFAPRFSFAYDLTGNANTAIRGGYGLFYSREILGAFILMSGNPPFSQLVTILNTNLSNPGGGTTRDFDLPITLGSIDLDQLTPYVQQWNLNIQHRLVNNTVLEVGYSGSRTIHMMRTQDINQPLPSAGVAQGSAGNNANQNRPYKGWGVINHREQSYAASYNGLQMGVTRNFSRGLGLTASYTWSKALDNADFTAGIYGFSPNTRNQQERGRASFDATHNFVASYIYDLPFLRNRHDVLGAVLGGWQVSGITTIRTGLPLNPVLGRDYAGVGAADRQRPQTSGSPALGHDERTVDRWFDTTKYAAPAFGTFSSTGRNILSLPGWHNWDLSLTKNFKIRERTNFELRADAFNFVNHTQFNAVGASMAVPTTFGKVTSARNERTLMLGFRLQF